MLFAGQRFPLGVDSTRIPEGVEEAVHFDPKDPENAIEKLEKTYGFAGDGRELPPGATSEMIQNMSLGPLINQLNEIEDKLRPGYGQDANCSDISPS